MPEIILYSAISLDNFIARPDGAIDWLSYPEYHLEKEDFGYKDFISNVGISIMGRKTYEQVRDFEEEWKPGDSIVYILTRNPGQDAEDLKYIRGDFSTFLEEMKSTLEKDIWVVGGGEVDTLALETGLVDRMIITVIPLLLGGGIRFFEGEYGEHRFHLERTQSYPNGFIQLEYTRIPR